MITLYFVGAFFLGYLAYWRRETALLILVALLPLYGLRFSLLGLPTTVLEISIWAVFIGWFIGEWKEHGAMHLQFRLARVNPFRPYAYPIMLWLLVSLAAALYAPNVFAGIGLWRAYFVEPLMVFVMLVLTFKNNDRRMCIVWALGGTMALMSLYAWVQHFTGAFLPAPWNKNLPLRVTSWYSYPNAVGLFAAPIIVLFGVWLMRGIAARETTSKHFTTKLIIFLFGLGAIIFAVSKGAWVGVAAGLSIGALLVFRSRWKTVASVIAVLAILALVIAPVRTRLFDEFFFQSPSGVIRLVVWQETAALLKAHPIVGAGLGGYQAALVPYHQWWRKNVSPYKLEIFLYPHNVFLNFWTELGLVGLVVFLWLEYSFFAAAWKKRDGLLSMMAMAAMAALIVHGLVDVPYFKNDLAVLFWIIMALPLLDPSEHQAHLHSIPFGLFRDGNKSVEIRVNDPKRQNWFVGDRVRFFEQNSDAELLAEIIVLHHQPTFVELLGSLPLEDFGFTSFDEGMMRLHQHYSEYDERKRGVVGIRIRIVER